MAKKNKQNNAGNAKVTGTTDLGTSNQSSATPATDSNRSTIVNETTNKSITAAYKGTQKNGIQTFTVEGVGSFYANKSLLNGSPKRIVVTIEDDDAATFNLSGTGAVAARGVVSPERAQKALDAATKAAERSAKSAAKAKDLQEKADRLKAALAGGTPAEQASEPAAETVAAQ